MGNGSPPRVCLVSASRQNVFFSELLEAFGSMLAGAGLEIERSVDCFPPAEDGLVYMFVPHEVHALVHELAHPTPAQLQRSILICTEQPGTEWFDLSVGVAQWTRAVLDINELGVKEMRRRGVGAERLHLGYVPDWDAWGGEERERSLDLVFLGGHSDRRASVLARCAPHLEGRRAALTLTETMQPHSGEAASYWAWDRKWKMLADARLILNIHRSAQPYMEWHRVLGAQMNGCVVVTEHAIGIDPMVPGEHYVSADYWQLPAVVGGLLDDPDRVREIAATAYRFLREEMPAERTLASLLDAVERASAPSPVAAGGVASVPIPNPPAVARPPWEEQAEHAGETLAVRRGLKDVMMRLRGLESHVAGLAAAGEPAADTIVEYGPRDTEPTVSVLLTVHNYADHVGDAIRSVAVSSHRELEVIAVDDASSDGSIAAVEASCELYPWLPLTHVRLTHNHGLPAARNLAISHARSDLLFILDADNEVLPTGIERLVEALEEKPEASFAYGIIQSFDSTGPVDLMNWLAWDPHRLRHGNYIDAMALLRRSALEEVEGYPTDPALYGWEDFAVWLALAEAGHDCAQVTDFVGRYRRSPHSMIALTNVDSTAAWSALVRRFPSLVGGAPA